jgi:hypothetical protein
MDENKSKMSPIHSYSLVDMAENPTFKCLAKDGKLVKCHKIAPMLIPSGLTNQLEIRYERCSTMCSRALIATDGEKTMFVQTCEIQQQSYHITNVEIKKPFEIIK